MMTEAMAAPLTIIGFSLGVELVLGCAALLLLLLGLLLPARNAARLVCGLSVVVLLALAALLLWIQQDWRFGSEAMQSNAQTNIQSNIETNIQSNIMASLIYQHFRLDAFALFAKLLILLTTACVLVIGRVFVRNDSVSPSLYRFEYSIIVLLATLGMCLMVSAQSLLALYVGLELQSLALYICAAFQRDNLRSSEAGLKYFMLGALSSALLLFGCSLLYGSVGAIDFASILSAASLESSLMLQVGMVLTLSALAFKISAVPFHMWTPDVYEGAPSSTVAFLATASKIAALGLLMRLLVEAFLPLREAWQPILAMLALASMVLGALATLPQSNIKRFIAYSAIAHIGILLIGFTTATPEGMRAVLFYLSIYMVMSLGLFAVLLALRNAGQPSERLSDLSGLSRSDPKAALALSVLMFSMAGLPPFAGFFAKFYVFLAALRGDLAWLALCGVGASVVSAFYYIRIVKVMYFDEPQEQVTIKGRSNRWILYASACAVTLLTLSPSWLLQQSEQAVRVLFAL